MLAVRAKLDSMFRMGTRVPLDTFLAYVSIAYGWHMYQIRLLNPFVCASG